MSNIINKQYYTLDTDNIYLVSSILRIENSGLLKYWDNGKHGYRILQIVVDKNGATRYKYQLQLAITCSNTIGYLLKFKDFYNKLQSLKKT